MTGKRQEKGLFSVMLEVVTGEGTTIVLIGHNEGKFPPSSSGIAFRIWLARLERKMASLAHNHLHISFL